MESGVVAFQGLRGQSDIFVNYFSFIWGMGCSVCHSICTEKSEAIFPVSLLVPRGSQQSNSGPLAWQPSPSAAGPSHQCWGYSYWKFPFGKTEQSGRWVDPRQHGCIYPTELRVYNCPLLRPVMCVPHHSKRMILPKVLMYLKLQKTRVATQGSPLVF